MDYFNFPRQQYRGKTQVKGVNFQSIGASMTSFQVGFMPPEVNKKTGISGPPRGRGSRGRGGPDGLTINFDFP